MRIILSKEELSLTVKRLAYQLLEDVTDLEKVVFIGIQPRGAAIADAIVAEMKKLTTEQISYGLLDITFYRDDVREELHEAKETKIDFDINGKKVVLIDDVLYTGRTVRAALDALQDFGRPAKVELAVLVNRQFSRELPIQPDYCGMAINTRPDEKIKADWQNEQVIIYS